MNLLRALFISFLALLPGVVQAGYHGVNVDDIAEVDLLPGWRTDAGTHLVALRIKLAPGWKTYWRAPGQAGIPPRFDWRRSKNLQSVHFLWPTPEVFEQNGLRSVGYAQELVLPIEMTPKRRGEEVEVKAEIEIGVCEDICIPVSVRVAARLAGKGASDARIKAALNARPDTAREAGMQRVTCAVEPISDGLRLTALLDMPPLGPEEVAVFELPDQRIWIAEAVTQRAGNRLTAVTEMVPPSSRPFSLDRSQVRITVISSGRAVDIQGCSG